MSLLSERMVAIDTDVVTCLTLARCALGAIAAFLAYQLCRAIYFAFASPLAKVPGPFACKVSGIPEFVNTLIRGRRSEWIYELHQQYGPVVRIAPNTLAFAEPAAAKTIYTGNGFLKSYARYHGKNVDGVQHSLTFIEPSQSKRRRSILLPLFQRNNLETFIPHMEEYLAKFLNQVAKEQKHEGSVDLYRWLRLLAFDVIGQLAYGVDLNMTATGKEACLVEDMSSAFLFAVILETIPFASSLAKFKIFSPLYQLRAASHRFKNFGIDILQTLESNGELEHSGEQVNLLRSLHRETVQASSGVTREHATAEAGAVLIAGSDTTSTAMTYACWELSRRPDIQERIRDELRTVTDDVNAIPSVKALESLSYFNAFLKEVLRRWPTLPGTLERIAPSMGASISGFVVPGGTEVTTTAFAVHRDPTLFPAGDKLVPERWLDETPEMRGAFLPFSIGPRNCVGMNLAWAEIRLVLGTLLRRYKILPHASTTAESMAPEEFFFVTPKAHQCRLVLRPVED
ncbi:hypothetical protein OIV83_005625 [Microbotryomycetes sp. JL201]|nr:hypothetical protein OIV83_005625 [Microbotryomycetes sp. JL201]